MQLPQNLFADARYLTEPALNNIWNCAVVPEHERD